MSIDLDNLADEVLFYSNDRFYKFIEEYLGVDEMNLIKLQSIKNSKTLISVPNVLAILNFKCKEIIELKHRLCFIDDDNDDNFVVKSGITTSINDLIKALKEKNIKCTKRARYLKSSASSTSSSTSSALSSSSNVNNLSSDMSLLNTLNSNSNEPQSTPEISTVPQSMPIDAHIQSISDRIEKFSLNTFRNLILKNNDDYTICLNTLGSNIYGSIKCGCNTNIKIIFRSKSKSFQLSAYLKHLKNSRCLMMKKKKQDLDKTNRTTNNSLDDALRDENDSNIDDSDDCNEVDLNQDDDNSQVTANILSIHSSDSIRRKRSLPHSSTSNNKKKTKSQ